MTSKRDYSLDWLRVIAFGLLILYHAGMPFTGWGWHIDNAETSEWLRAPMYFVNRWRLPLLFFVSGAGTAFALGRRGAGEFLRERAARLLVPLVFAMFVIVPPQIYWERLDRGQFSGSYWQWYPNVLAFRPYPQGDFSWHHMWFVLYLFVISAALLPVLRWCRGRELTWLRQPAALLLLPVPSFAIAVTLGARYPTTHALWGDWANLAVSAWTFFVGFLFARDARLLDTARRLWRPFVLAGVVTFLLLYTRTVTGWWREAAGAWNGLFWIVGLAGLARERLSFSNAFLQYAAPAVFPFYILHQTVTVGLVYAVVGWMWPWWAKWIIVSLGTFVLTAIAYEFVIRRVRVLGPFFGLKAR